jgi:hypothetical protein
MIKASLSVFTIIGMVYSIKNPNPSIIIGIMKTRQYKMKSSFSLEMYLLWIGNPDIIAAPVLAVNHMKRLHHTKIEGIYIK